MKTNASVQAMPLLKTVRTGGNIAEFTGWDFFVLLSFVVRDRCCKLLEGNVSLQSVNYFPNTYF